MVEPAATLPGIARPTFRLILGDGLAVLREMRGRYHAIVSDPPYGIAYRYHGGGRKRAGFPAQKARSAPILGDDAPFDPSPLTGAGVPCLLWGANHYAGRLPGGGSWLAWDKTGGGMGPKDNHGDADFAWCNVPRVKRNSFSYLWKGIACKKAGDLDPDGKFRRHHPTQKPVPLMAWCIGLLGLEPGATILDPYAGSGATGRAALRLGFNFIGAEVDPGYHAEALALLEWEATRGGI